MHSITTLGNSTEKGLKHPEKLHRKMWGGDIIHGGIVKIITGAHILTSVGSSVEGILLG